MKEPNEEFAQPLLNDLIYDPSIKLLEKKDEEMRDSYEKYNKLLNKMKKNVDNMGSNKLMNYQNLFNEYNNDVIKFNEEQKKLIELKDSLNSEIKLPPKIKKNLDKVNKDFENKQKLFEKIKTKVEEYKDKYTKEENKKYDEIFNKKENKENEDEDINEQKLIVKNNEEIFEERKNMIIEAKKTSSQVVDTTKIIKNVVHQQGENINDIENNIIEAVDNFKKGGEEINKFKNTTEKQIDRKKLMFFGGAIIVLVLIIYFLVRKLF
jgi:syntaxin 7